MACEVAGCQYQTRAGLNSYDQQFQQIRLHLAMAHPDVRELLDNSMASNASTQHSAHFYQHLFTTIALTMALN